jgi:hypothetical protein
MLLNEFKGTSPRGGEWRSRSSAPAIARPIAPDRPGTTGARTFLIDSRAESSSTLLASKQPRYLPADAALDRAQPHDNAAAVALTPTSGTGTTLAARDHRPRVSHGAAIGHRWRQFAKQCAASADALARDALPRAWMRQRGAATW